jgi:hypothetical protein
MKVKELMNYIEENLADGCLTEDSEIIIQDDDSMDLEITALYNNCKQLTIEVEV